MDDIEIIKSIQSGDTESFSLLVQKYHAHLLNFIYRLMRDREVVEDIGQEVFLSVYKSMRGFNTARGVPFSAWLFITARNRCVSELRKKNRPMVPIEENRNLPAHVKTPEQSASEEERLLAIHAALEQLPEPFKAVILQSLQGDSPEQIAMSNRISIGTVKSRLSRARERLRLLLNAHPRGNQYDRF